MPDNANPVKAASERKLQLDTILIQLNSQRPSEVWRGMEQTRQWLRENPEDLDVYGLLLDVVQKNRELREQVRNLFHEMTRNGSKYAEEAISRLPSNVQDFLADANDAYYAAEYERAISLYRQVLRLDPENAHAKDHLAKAEIKRITGESATGLPRVAEQYYRRARSYIATRDVVTAMNLLSAAIETAQAKGMRYPDAEEALNNMQNLLVADEFRQQAKTALDESRWKDALGLYDKGLTLDATNEVMKKERDSIQDLLLTETALKKRGLLKILMPIGQVQKTVEANRIIMKPSDPLLNSIEKQLNQIRLFRTIGAVLLLAIIIFPLYRNVGRVSLFTPAVTQTEINTPQMIATNTEMPITEPVISTSIPPTDTPLPPSTETFTPTPTQATLGIGYINKATASAWNEPNSGLIERLTINHPLTLLEKKEVGGDIWYRCKWDTDATDEGWILAEYITFGPPPTARP